MRSENWTRAAVSLALICSLASCSQSSGEVASAAGMAPSIGGVSTLSVPSTGGTSIVIRGSNFRSGARVRSGNADSPQVVGMGTTEIQGTTPPHSAGTVQLAMINSDGRGSNSISFNFKLAPAPTVNSISPSTVSSAGGTMVTLTGSNFQSGATVRFGSANSAQVTFVNPAQRQAVTAAHVAGTVAVTLTNPDDQADTLNGAYTFVADTLDTIPPSGSISSPAESDTVSGDTAVIAATASEKVRVAGVQFKLDGANLESEDTVAPYSVTWNTTFVADGSHVLTAVARDDVGNTATSSDVGVNVSNPFSYPSLSCSNPPPGTIWCDDFEDSISLTTKYFDYNDDGGEFVPIPGVGTNGSVGLRGRWDTGDVNAGYIRRSFGRNPAGSQSHSTINFDEIYWRIDVRPA